ncbi:MAG: diguanylate cyclase [Bacteroidales bacterium]|nr:diguanylate cyclase [Bacteroidales bacterium]
MNGEIVVAETICFLSLAFILIGILSRNVGVDNRAKAFIGMLCASMFALLVDALSYMCDDGRYGIEMIKILNSLSYSVGSLVIIPFAYYVYFVLCKQNNVNIWYFHAPAIVTFSNVIYIVYLGLTEQLFSIVEGHFEEGQYPIISEIIFFGLMLYFPVIMFRSGNRSNVRQITILCIYILFPFVAELWSVISNTTESYTIVGVALAIQLIFVMLQNNIIDEQQKALQLAHVDSLTGIANRYIGNNEINDRIALRKPFTLILLDVDKFKFINDNFGHPVGDSVLQAIASILQTTFSEGVPVRLGGDEFLVILDGSRRDAEIETMMKLLFKAISDIQIKGIDQAHNFAISVGVARYDGSEDKGFDYLYHVADERLYRSKQQAGCFYHLR